MVKILGEEINEKDLMDYWNSSEEFEDMLTREADEAMKPCIFKSHSLCMFVGCAEDDGWSSETITEINETLEVKYDGECLLEKEGTNLLKQNEIIDEFLFGVRQPVEAIVVQKHNEYAEVIFQGGKIGRASCRERVSSPV